MVIMKPKVTLIGTLPPLKGISPYCQELLKSLSEKTEVEFIGFKKLYPDFLYPGGTKIKDENYRIPEIENAEIRNILTYYNPLSWIWAGVTLKGHIVHFQWWAYPLAPIYIVILILAKLRKKKVIITVHNVLPHEKKILNNFLNWIILYFGDKLIVHSENNKKYLTKFYNIPGENIFVIPHGVLMPVNIKGISKERAREYLGIPNDKKVILHFGNIRGYKGLDVLLESMNIIKEKIYDIILLIGGEPWEDWAEYQKIIDRHELEGYIMKKLNFIPPSEVEYYFSASDIVVLPYKYFDSQSGVGALALPFKKPIIVTNVGGLPDFVKDEQAIARPNDPEDLARVIIRVLNGDNLLLKLAKDSEELTKEYSWDVIAEKTCEAYRRLV